MKPTLALAAVVASLITATAQAALVFNLDPIGETFTFTGSDTGTPNSNASGGRTDFAAPFSLRNTSNASRSINAAITADSGLSVFATSFFRIQGSASTRGYAIEIFTGDDSTQSIFGTGETVDYGGSFTATQKADLSTFVAGGGQFALSFGGGFSPISTQIVAVPEPSTWALLAVTAVFFATTVGRRYRSRS